MDPWDARTLEWTIPSPPPAHNFDQLPVVSSRDELWHRKHPHLEPLAGATKEEIAAAKALVGEETEIVMPGGSYMPLLMALGIFVAGWGLLYSMPLFWIGVAWTIVSMMGWGLEGDNVKVIRVGGEKA